MLRRFAATPSIATAAATAARTMYVYSEQHPVLINNQKGFKYQSNVWVEEWETKTKKFQSKLKEGEVPTPVPGLQQVIKMQNLSQLTETPADFAEEPSTPSSMSSRLPYQGQMQESLEEAKLANGWTSNWFFANGWLYKNRDYRLIPDFRVSKPVGIMIKGKSSVYNADQFEDPQAVEQTIISGGSRKAFGPSSEFTIRLKEHTVAKGYKTGLYFTQRILNELELQTKATATGCVPDEDAGKFYQIYNISEVQDWEKLLNDHHRAPVDSHCYFYSGREVALNKQEILDNMSFESKFWVSEWDIKSKKLKLSADAQGVKMESSKVLKEPTVFYNVEELEDPEKGFAVAGHALN